MRQGDLLSHCIFVLCMDKLTHIISEVVDNKRWKPIRVGTNGPCVSHLMFAYDLILFSEVEVNQIEVMIEFLNTYYIILEQKINLGKSNIFFSRDVKQDLRVNIIQ